jgi:hypothetical protein
MTVPSLDEIAADPATAERLPTEAARALLARCVIVQNALLIPALRAPTPDLTAKPPREMDRPMLTPKQAAHRFNIPKRWLLAHADQIPGLTRLSRKTIRFDEEALDRWLAHRRRPLTPVSGRREIPT